MSDANLFGVPAKAKRAKAAPLPNGAVQRLIGVYVGLFEARFREKPAITPRDGSALKRLILLAGEATVAKRLPRYLELPDDYVAAEGYPLVLLPSVWNKLIAAERVADRRAVPDADATERYLRSRREGR